MISSNTLKLDNNRITISIPAEITKKFRDWSKQHQSICNFKLSAKARFL